MTNKGYIHAKTKVQMQRVLNYIDNYWRFRGISPTIREITRGLGISSTSVTNHIIDRLELEGKLTHQKYSGRTYVTKNHFPPLANKDSRYQIIVQEDGMVNDLAYPEAGEAPYDLSAAVEMMNTIGGIYSFPGWLLIWFRNPETGIYESVEVHSQYGQVLIISMVEVGEPFLKGEYKRSLVERRSRKEQV